MRIHLKHPDCAQSTADLGSITKANAGLEVSPPTISVAIKGFEEQFGYRVFIAAAGVKMSQIDQFEVADARTDVGKGRLETDTAGSPVEHVLHSEALSFKGHGLGMVEQAVQHG